MIRSLFFIIIATLFTTAKGQLCGGSFGNPVFTENFGSVNYSGQTVSPALQPPAYTNYIYRPAFPIDDGEYTIANDVAYSPWNWSSAPDHTSDAPGTYGNMLIVNASFATGEFYRRRVDNLCSNQVYRFSAWIMNIHRTGANLIRPNVTMQIRSVGGAVLGSVNTGDLPESSAANWQNFYLDFRSDISSSSVEVVLINNARGGIGNDLALDDITFSPCGPATSFDAGTSTVFSSGVCDNNAPVSLTASVNSNTFSSATFIWQKSPDGGSTWVDLTTPTRDRMLNIPAGSYKNGDLFRFIVGEGNNVLSPNCRVISSSQKIIVTGYAVAPLVSDVKYCLNVPAQPLSATGSNLLWYSSEIGGTASTLAPTPSTSTAGTQTFWVSQKVNGCEGARSKITVSVEAPPAPPLASAFSFCEGSPSAFSAQGANLLWYRAQTGGAGSSEAPTVDTSTPGNYSFWVSQIINRCESDRAEVKVSVLPKPFSSALKDTSVCDGGSVILDAGPGFSAYEWNTVPPSFTQMIKVANPGDYSVKITDAQGCTTVQTATVSKGITPVVKNIKSGDGFLEISVEGGNPPYQYSLDQQRWQNSNVFYNLPSAIYTVYIKSAANDCQTSTQTAVLMIPNVITPNQDSYNDQLKINFTEFFPEAKIKIFDRYGKLIFESKNAQELMWDGTDMQRNAVSGTYWYIFTAGNGLQRTGWILVKNRN